MRTGCRRRSDGGRNCARWQRTAAHFSRFQFYERYRGGTFAGADDPELAIGEAFPVEAVRGDGQEVFLGGWARGRECHRCAKDGAGEELIFPGLRVPGLRPIAAELDLDGPVDGGEVRDVARRIALKEFAAAADGLGAWESLGQLVFQLGVQEGGDEEDLGIERGGSLDQTIIGSGIRLKARPIGVRNALHSAGAGDGQGSQGGDMGVAWSGGQSHGEGREDAANRLEAGEPFLSMPSATGSCGAAVLVQAPATGIGGERDGGEMGERQDSFRPKR